MTKGYYNSSAFFLQTVYRSESMRRIAFGAIKPELLKRSSDTGIKDQINSIQTIFELVCLLHDVGHAPFSHTEETFFLDEAETLYKNFKSSVDDECFTMDFDALGTKKPAPHECMSCIIGMMIRFAEKAPDFKAGMNECDRQEVTKH